MEANFVAGAAGHAPIATVPALAPIAVRATVSGEKNHDDHEYMVPDELHERGGKEN